MVYLKRLAIALAVVVLALAALAIPGPAFDPNTEAAPATPARVVGAVAPAEGSKGSASTNSASSTSSTAARTGSAPFRWDNDALWQRLEERFVAAKESGCAARELEIGNGRARIGELLDDLGTSGSSPADRRWDGIEATLFEFAPLVAACPDGAAGYIEAFARIRSTLKGHSVQWDPNDRVVKERLYRMLYGGRAAVEEVLLQMDADEAAELVLMRGFDEPSESPTLEINGVSVHSGDILVSRGGYPTSALIARGSDFPGNFSHVGLVQINKNDQPSIIEAHIDHGLSVATVPKYFSDRKMRVMLLRPRRDLPGIEENPLAPHIAASRALARAQNGHVPYDFEMDYTDPSELFCSEVASSAYDEFDITLWAGLSTISAPGLKRWLASFGVRHFETQEPSDLEYDPQLVVVAEWRNPVALYRDHVDNAVVDAMLEGAEAGDRLDYPFMMLPFARVAKGYSVLLNELSRVGPVPEGMSATAALRSRAYSRRHAELARAVLRDAAAFQDSTDYRAPYWKLVEFARAAVQAERS